MEQRSLSRTSPLAALIFELLNASTKLHLIHLSVTGAGSYAAHKALNEIYDSIKSFADDLAEQYQGLTETLLVFPTSEAFPKTVTGSEAIVYLRELYSKVESVQKTCNYSEINNTLDEIKSLINTTKYKLLFLK